MTTPTKERVLKVLVACEESQAVCKAFRALGHKAFSCDLQECSGGHPEWHIKCDVLKVLNLPIWDLVIAHPPCTYLTVAANRYYDVSKYGEKAKARIYERVKAEAFFMNFVFCECEHIAIENPVGVMSTYYKKPTQIIQPYEYGHNVRKKTCLWLKGLPPLKPTEVVKPDIITLGPRTYSKFHIETLHLPADKRAKERSKTFEGIAKAMAKQWSEYILQEDK